MKSMISFLFEIVFFRGEFSDCSLIGQLRQAPWFVLWLVDSQIAFWLVNSIRIPNWNTDWLILRLLSYWSTLSESLIQILIGWFSDCSLIGQFCQAPWYDLWLVESQIAFWLVNSVRSPNSNTDWLILRLPSDWSIPSGPLIWPLIGWYSSLMGDLRIPLWHIGSNRCLPRVHLIERWILFLLLLWLLRKCHLRRGDNLLLLWLPCYIIHQFDIS